MGAVLGVGMVVGGVFVAHTDVGPWLAPTLVASGCATIASGSPQLETGAGITYQDHWKHPIVYIGKDSTAVDNYMNKKYEEKKEISNNLNNRHNEVFTDIDNYNFKLSNFQININYLEIISEFRYKSLKLYVQKYITPSEFSKFNFESITTYNFDPNISFDKYNLKNLLEKIKPSFSLDYYGDKFDAVHKIYVIRRKLEKSPVFFGWIAHSALLLVNWNKNGAYICEYGVEKNPNKVTLTKLSDEDIKLLNNNDCSTELKLNGHIWKKQKNGQVCKLVITPEEIKDTMMDKVKRHCYSLLFWNCHVAQEMTRKELMIDVKNSYIDGMKKMYEDEWNITSDGF